MEATTFTPALVQSGTDHTKKVNSKSLQMFSLENENLLFSISFNNLDSS